MTKFAVVPGLRWHLGRITRTLRVDHEAGLKPIGLGTHSGLSVAFLMSSDVRAWFIDGDLAAVGGVISTEASSVGVIWLAVAQMATRYPLQMFKTAKRWLMIFAENRHELRITVVIADGASVRFAERLGFVMTGEKTEDGLIAVMKLTCGGA